MISGIITIRLSMDDDLTGLVFANTMVLLLILLDRYEK